LFCSHDCWGLHVRKSEFKSFVPAFLFVNYNIQDQVPLLLSVLSLSVAVVVGSSFAAWSQHLSARESPACQMPLPHPKAVSWSVVVVIPLILTTTLRCYDNLHSLLDFSASRQKHQHIECLPFVWLSGLGHSCASYQRSFWSCQLQAPWFLWRSACVSMMFIGCRFTIFMRHLSHLLLLVATITLYPFLKGKIVFEMWSETIGAHTPCFMYLMLHAYSNYHIPYWLRGHLCVHNL